MALSLGVDLALLFGSALATVVCGLEFRKRRAWPVIVLFLVPIAVSVGGGDLLATWTGALLAPHWPTVKGAWWWWALWGALLWIPTEITQQQICTRLAGGGRIDRPARDR